MTVMSFRGRTGRLNGPAVILCVAILLLPAQASGWSDEAPAQDAPQGCFLSEKAGFTLIHLEGDPATIGRNHGSLLSEKIERGMAAYAHCSMDWFGLSWAQCRFNAPSYWPKVPSEYRQEIQGIASGAASMGVVNPDGATVDWIDILAYNAAWDIWWRVSPPGNKFWWLPGKGEEDWPHHCSGFASTGSWTADGGFVLAQSLWMPYFLPPAQAVWCDLAPRQGNRIFMQLTAGMIWSGTEYYVNSAGIVAAETTLGVGAHQPGGTASFVRIRKAVQYAGSIDEFRDIILQDTNGAYCSDYLVADAKTNEVAVLELGGRTWALARTMDGFLPSCNYPWDPAVAAEMGEPQGAAHGCWPRWMRLLDLAAQERGNITVEFGKMALGDHFDVSVGYERPGSFSLCGHGENTTRGYPHGSQDAKVTNRTMAARMQVWARFGHSCGRSFLVEEQQALHPDYAFDDLRDMIAGPWATFGAFHQLQISVMDQNGLPIQDAELRLRDRYDGNQTNITLEDGRILVPYFPAGEYEVSASGNGRKATMLLVVNGSASLDIVLRGGGSPDAVPAMQAGAVAVVALAGAISVVIWKRRRRSA